MTTIYLSINPIKKTVEQFPHSSFEFRSFAINSFVFKIEQTNGNMSFQLSRFVPETNDWGGSSRQSTMEQAKLRCILDAYVLHLQKSSDTTQWLKSLYNDEAKTAKLEPVL